MMVDIHTIQTTSEVFDLYLKQKSEFHFQQKSDNDFIVFLLDTAVRVISIGNFSHEICIIYNYDSLQNSSSKITIQCFGSKSRIGNVLPHPVSCVDLALLD
jgi:hypothetical protein